MNASQFFLFIMFFTAALLPIAYTTTSTQKAKQTNLVLYMNENHNGPTPTATIVAGKNGTSSSIFEFGTVIIFDDPVTEGPSKDSKQIGRLQGFGINSRVDGKGLYTAFSVIFTDGEFKGSTLQIHGYEDFLQKQREVSVASGTGHFRFAKGYAILESQAVDLVNMISVFKFSITVHHFDESPILSEATTSHEEL